MEEGVNDLGLSVIVGGGGTVRVSDWFPVIGISLEISVGLPSGICLIHCSRNQSGTVSLVVND